MSDDDRHTTAGAVLGERFAGLVVEDAPEHVVAGAVAAFRAGRPSVPRLLDRAVARVRAVLEFDDWSATPTFALRGAHTDAATRHLVFGAGADEIALSLYRDGARTTVVGHLLADEPAGRRVEVLDRHALVGSASTSTTGEFVVAVDGAWDEIVLVDAEGEIVIGVDVTGAA